MAHVHVHWLDSNVLMEAHRKYYSFDIAPGFWSSIAREAHNGVVRSPLSVLGEILEGTEKDQLKIWAKGKGKELFVVSGKDEQEAVGEISAYVIATYSQHQAAFFLSKADPWVISHALVGNGIVVTQEAPVGPDSTKVKIPNVCKQFKVKCINTYDLLRTLKIVLQ
jgi:hypothetical protein